MVLKPVKIPSAILDLLDRQAAELARLAPAHRRRLLGIAVQARRRLEQRLRQLSPERYTTQETRVLLAQVRQMTDIMAAEFGRDVAGEIKSIGLAAAGVGRDTLVAEIDAWGQLFPGSVRGISRPRLAGDLLDDGLLEYYESSRSRYGLTAMRDMRSALAQATLTGETLVQTMDRLSEAMKLGPSWAERIVRTEQSLAVHRRQLEDMREVFGEDLETEWTKQLVASFDQRTGDDSRFVHGQRRRMGEDFVDNYGRRYQHPPNRPNDREVMVMVPAGMSLVPRAG